MRRFALAAVPFAFLFVAGACGGGSGKDSQSKETAVPDAEATQNVNEQPQVADKPLPTPTAVTDDLVPVVQVAFAGKLFAPTKTEFAALPKTKISAGGKDYEGVVLSALVQKAAAGSASVVTIQGTRVDNLRLGAVRFPLADVGSTTVLVMDDSGHIILASSSIPADQWLKDVVGVSLN
ncbi:MAG: hypothetical protein ABI577_15460 [bacterium]